MDCGPDAVGGSDDADDPDAVGGPDDADDPDAAGNWAADWLRAGQATHRLLITAAAEWVFASLHTQALENPAVRALIRSRLGLPGEAQMLLQLGLSGTTRPTPRRPARELLIRPRHGPTR